jgi:hypothetical protein
MHERREDRKEVCHDDMAMVLRRDDLNLPVIVIKVETELEVMNAKAWIGGRSIIIPK